MASVTTRSFKQTNGYFVPLADIRAKVFTYTPGTGAGGSFLPGSFALAAWANSPGVGAGAASTLVASSGAGLLKDMGKTVVSANRTFRKVQAVFPGLSTSGVSQMPGVSIGSFLTGYLELAGPAGAAAGNTDVAPVAYLPGLF